MANSMDLTNVKKITVVNTENVIVSMITSKRILKYFSPNDYEEG
jgi:predicted transcriptional regulator